MEVAEGKEKRRGHTWAGRLVDARAGRRSVSNTARHDYLPIPLSLKGYDLNKPPARLRYTWNALPSNGLKFWLELEEHSDQRVFNQTIRALLWEVGTVKGDKGGKGKSYVKSSQRSHAF